MNAGEASAAAGCLMLGSVVFLAGQLGAGRRAVSAGGGLPSGFRRPLAELADCVAARRLAVAVCAQDELSRGKSSSN
jgi:hypothetical protein